MNYLHVITVSGPGGFQCPVTALFLSFPRVATPGLSGRMKNASYTSSPPPEDVYILFPGETKLQGGCGTQVLQQLDAEGCARAASVLRKLSQKTILVVGQAHSFITQVFQYSLSIQANGMTRCTQLLVCNKLVSTRQACQQLTCLISQI